MPALFAVVGLVADAVAEGVGVWGGGLDDWRQAGVAGFPEAQQQQDQDDAEEEEGEGADPGYGVKAAAYGLGERDGAVLGR